MENMDLLPPTAPSLVFARETFSPYYVMKTLLGREPKQFVEQRVLQGSIYGSGHQPSSNSL